MFFIFLCIFVLAPAVLSEGIQKCETWKNIEEKLKETALQVNCTHTTTCTGISCFLEKYGYEVQSGLHMNACEKPSSVEFEINIPKLNIKQWKRKFYHGATFSLNDNVSGKFEMEKYKDNITLGLTLQIHSNSPSSSVLHLLPTILPDIEYPVFHNIVFPMPSCVIKNDSEHTTVSKSFISGSISFTTSNPAVTPVFQNLGMKQEYFNCSIRNGSCPEHELCQQTEKSKPEGTCVCMPDYVRDKTGKCIYSPSTVTTTETPEALHLQAMMQPQTLPCYLLLF
ncbi:uncharacterized protein CEXT_663911 [Caerostris extrusa]|uniref:EGF-like domain-containing protein n=1 Tax=Caerostris extrusa TaxID=172846 RepID=A0AAV4PZ42_CAEEX|nr:uncharacterized protein CEXT_663911 [Caerostris extrusa]